eukprot:SAG31_NODE_947_length_10828_cov_3.713953_3_plen_42_part_00
MCIQLESYDCRAKEKKQPSSGALVLTIDDFIASFSFISHHA